MRVGSRVAITRMREDGTWERHTGCKKRPEGTVIGLDIDDCDGHIRYDFATIRWDDGSCRRKAGGRWVERLHRQVGLVKWTQAVCQLWHAAFLASTH